MPLSCWFLALAFAAPRSAPLSELADRVAAEIARLAGERAVEVAIPEDRTGRGAVLVLDLHGLILSRLAGRTPTAESGPRLRVALVLSESAGALVASGRVVEEPGGRLVDLVSASIRGDSAALTLSASRLEAAGRDVEVTASSRTPPVAGPVLDVAFLGDDRLVVLTPDALATYRWESPGLVQEKRLTLPGPRIPVRLQAGLLRPEEGGSALWVMTNQLDGASLYATESAVLTRRAHADALPWPGAPEGLRYRPGTNLIEGRVGGLAGPYLALAGEASVQADAMVRAARAPVGAPTLRGGDRLSPLWGPFYAGTAASPPGARDFLQLLEVDDAGVRLRERLLEVDGRIRALAGRTRGEAARLVCAVEDADAVTHLLILEVRARSAGLPPPVPR